MGLSGALVSWADAPSTVLLVMRLVVAAAALTLVFWRRKPLSALLRRDLWPKLLLIGPLDGGSLLCYFLSIRLTGVAVATFLLFMQPVWVAVLAPHLLKTRTEKVVYLSLGAAVAGLAVIILPSLAGGGLELSAAGVAAGLAAGWLYAFFQLLVKDLTTHLDSISIVTVEVHAGRDRDPAAGAVARSPRVGLALSGRDVVAALILGLVCTAVAYSIWVEGVARIRVQHSSILGFLTPVVAPLFAWVLLGEDITLTVALGGALIIVAGVLVVLFGEAEGELEPL